MMYGVWIDDKNTLTEWGLCLLADVTIGSPEPRTSYVTVPEADGDLDLTGALTGGVVRYGMREISFELFPAHDVIAGKPFPASEEHAALIRQSLAKQIHGKKCKLWLPDDGGHYFYGRMAVGEKGGYNNTTIPVTMTAEPWRYKTTETVRTITASGNYILPNEMRRAQLTFTATDAVATVTFNGTSHQLVPGNQTFDDVILVEGPNAISFSGIVQPVTIKYQEGVI